MKTELNPSVTPSSDLFGWLRGKIADAERAVKAREQSAAVWRDGTNAEWDEACAIHPKTVGRAAKKAERLVIAKREDRIAEKCRRELQNLRTIASYISILEGECDSITLQKSWHAAIHTNSELAPNGFQPH